MPAPRSSTTATRPWWKPNRGYDRAFAFPGFVPAYIRPLFCEGKGPFRWAALSGDPADIHAPTRAMLKLFPDNKTLVALDPHGSASAWRSRACRPASAGSAMASVTGLGLRFNEMVRQRRGPRRPIVIGRDHLDCGSVASPYRETEAMLDGSDAIADWPLLNAMVNVASGASWVSIHHGGGVASAAPIHAGQVCVADGTVLAAQKLRPRAVQRPRDGSHPPRRLRI